MHPSYGLAEVKCGKNARVYSCIIIIPVVPFYSEILGASTAISHNKLKFMCDNNDVAIRSSISYGSLQPLKAFVVKLKKYLSRLVRSSFLMWVWRSWIMFLGSTCMKITMSRTTLLFENNIALLMLEKPLTLIGTVAITSRAEVSNPCDPG